MIYGFGGRIDNDSNAVTMIDEENRTAETKGYINGEFVEFSSGGGGAETLVATYNSTTHVLDKTYGEIAQAIENGGIGFVTIKMSDTEYCTILTFHFANDDHGYSMVVGDGMYMFQEGEATDYPMYVSD